MSSGGEPGHLHPQTSRTHGYQYFFYDKHHGRAGPNVARWAVDITAAEEFAIFDQADALDLADEIGNLYGLHIGVD